MTPQTRTVVDPAQQRGLGPVAAGSEYLARVMMEVQVPQRVDVFHLVAEYLKLFEPVARGQSTGTGARHTGLARLSN